MHEEMLTYGLKRGTKDDLQHIDSVPNGLVCDCVCPHCQHDLIARNGGTKKTHHFAHASGADCGGARMTALHILAQKILERDKVVMLPIFETEYVKHDAQQKEFANVVLEQVWKDDSSTRKPDCVCTQEDGENPLWVEIFCRHKVDDVRQKDIQRRKVYCIEIDFSDLLTKEYSEEDVIARLTMDIDHKKWICCPVWDKENESKRQKVLEEEGREIREREKKRETLEKESERLKVIVNQWYKKHDALTTAKIIDEIKNKPFSNTDTYEVCIYDILVPRNNWIKFAKLIPKTEFGREVFYTLILYYCRANFSSSPSNDHFWAEDKITEILCKFCDKKESYILLEYLSVLWVLSQLEKYRIFEDQNSPYGKIFAKNETVRKAVLQLLYDGKREWRDYLSDPKVHVRVLEKFREALYGEDIISIIKICYPMPKDIPLSSEPYGFDKEMKHISVNEAWKKINEEFKKQSY